MFFQLHFLFDHVAVILSEYCDIMTLCWVKMRNCKELTCWSVPTSFLAKTWLKTPVWTQPVYCPLGKQCAPLYRVAPACSHRLSLSSLSTSCTDLLLWYIMKGYIEELLGRYTLASRIFVGLWWLNMEGVSLVLCTGRELRCMFHLVAIRPNTNISRMIKRSKEQTWTILQTKHVPQFAGLADIQTDDKLAETFGVWYR